MTTGRHLDSVGALDAQGSALPSPFRKPTIRLRMDVGALHYGQPLAAGSGEVYLDVSATDTLLFLEMLGEDGYRALLHLLRDAVPTPTEGGGMSLELAGWSARYLQEAHGFTERQSKRAVAALRDSGLILVAAMPGARGSAGKQRAILACVSGVSEGGEGVVETRRGRRTKDGPGRPNAPTAGTVVTFPSNRPTDPSTVVTKASNGEASAQVSAVVTEPSKRPHLDLEEVGRRSSSLPSTPSRRSAAEGLADLLPRDADDFEDSQVAVDETSLLFGAFADWDEVRAVASLDSRAVYEALRPIVGDASSRAGSAARELRLGPEWGPAVADRVSTLLVEILTDTGGLAGHLWSAIRAAGIVLPPETPTEILAPRLLASVCAGLDSKVQKWSGWVGGGLRKPANEYTTSASLRRVVRAVESLAAVEIPPRVPDEMHTTPPASADPTPVASAAADIDGPTRLGEFTQGFGMDDEVLAAQTPTPTPPPEPVPARRATPAASPVPLDTDDLAAAVAWAQDVPSAKFFADMGAETLAGRPHFARQLVALWRESVPTVE